MTHHYKNLFILLTAAMVINSCQTPGEKESAQPANHTPGSFGYDLEFLQTKDSVIILQDKEKKAQIIVSPKYQGKVFTSTAEGAGGRSFGWVNYKAFEGTPDAHMNAYGGENRLWLGPEGSRYAIFFKPGVKMEFTDWHTPAFLDTESWNLDKVTPQSASMSKTASLQNYAGTVFNLRLNRSVTLIENAGIANALGISFTDQVKAVGFETDNTITNTGNTAWTKETGTLCIWILDMFTPSAKTVVVIPYDQSATGKVAGTDYFGEIPAGRIQYDSGALFFKADGRQRGKLGLTPGRAKPLAGSYDADNNVLTITIFDVDSKATYLNQEWNTAKNPWIGDAVNAYNDGPLETGTQMGPFYELESVSPAAFLQPAASLTHKHSVFHFTGDKEEINKIAVHLLGVSLQRIESAFQ